MLRFEKLNEGWNASPNDPDPRIETTGPDLFLRFRLNYYIFPGYGRDDIGLLTFRNCARFRLGGTNDEGWYMGQCRFGKRAPAWGEFYELIGDAQGLDEDADWCITNAGSGIRRHFLFYLRDDTFECTADDWAFSVERHSADSLIEQG
jgi:hypothetical protein